VIHYKTVGKSDHDFLSYLEGSFSKTQRALPIQSLNIESDQETITFRLVEIKEIERPSYFSLLPEILKMRTWLYAFFPMFLIFVKNAADAEPLHFFSYALACIAALFTFLGLQLRNDYIDYIRGSDRLRLNSQTKPLQKGWLAAWQVRNLSWMFLILAAVVSLPIYWMWPAVLYLVLGLVAVAVVFGVFKKSTYKFEKFHEFFVFLFLGPALFAGLQLSMGDSLDKETLFLGGIWGWLCVFQMYIKNFEDIATSSQYGLKNTINWLGFDRSKVFLKYNWLAFVFAFFIYHWFFASVFSTWFLTAVILFWTWPVLQKQMAVSSPLGSSHLQNIKRWKSLIVLVTILWFLENLFYISSMWRWLNLKLS